MRIKGPRSPFSSGAEPLEPLDPRDLQRAVKESRFAEALSQLESPAAGGSSQTAGAARSHLAGIAGSADLTTSEGTLEAVRSSARYLVESRLDEKYRDTEQGQRLIEDLSEYVAHDPLLGGKLTSVLRRLKEDAS